MDSKHQAPEAPDVEAPNASDSPSVAVEAPSQVEDGRDSSPQWSMHLKRSKERWKHDEIMEDLEKSCPGRLPRSRRRRQPQELPPLEPLEATEYYAEFEEMKSDFYFHPTSCHPSSLYPNSQRALKLAESLLIHASDLPSHIKIHARFVVGVLEPLDINNAERLAKVERDLRELKGRKGYRMRFWEVLVWMQACDEWKQARGERTYWTELYEEEETEGQSFSNRARRRLMNRLLR